MQYKFMVEDDPLKRNVCEEIKLYSYKPWFSVNDSYWKPTKITRWSFKSASDLDINWKDVKDSLSYKEPLAFITRTFKDGSEVFYVVVDKQLEKKAFATGMHELCPSVLEEIVKRVYWVNQADLADWVIWAKDVKEMVWPNHVKSNINVVLPNI